MDALMVGIIVIPAEWDGWVGIFMLLWGLVVC